MKGSIAVSIIINNYNYSRYLRQAIESALHQSYPSTEVIIVDDGSTDNSAEILKEYQDRSKIILKENEGQGSAFNTGFEISTGQIIVFLDADDSLLIDAVETIVEAFDNDQIAKVHWPLWVIDEHGNNSGELTPKVKLPDGHLLDKVVALGPNAYISPPTSGNAWSRPFLEKVLPMPAGAYTISADNYLCMLAPLYGLVKTIPQPLGCYRLHGKNNFRGKILEEDILLAKVDRYETSCLHLAEHLSRLHILGNIETWNKISWLQKLKLSIQDIKYFVPENETIILADGDQWQTGHELAGRKIIPFMEKNNKYWGEPSSDEEAIKEIERQIKLNAGFIFFAWPVFWWLDHYIQMVSYLRDHHECFIRNERLVGYKLNNPL